MPDLLQVQEIKLKAAWDKQVKTVLREEPVVETKSVQFRNESQLSQNSSIMQQAKKLETSYNNVPKLSIAETVNQVLCPVHGSTKPDFKARVSSMHALLI